MTDAIADALVYDLAPINCRGDEPTRTFSTTMSALWSDENACLVDSSRPAAVAQYLRQPYARQPYQRRDRRQVRGSGTARSARGGVPLHFHESQDETFYVIRAQVRFQVGDETFVAEEGATVYAPRGLPHSFHFVGDSESHVIIFVVPGETWRTCSKNSISLPRRASRTRPRSLRFVAVTGVISFRPQATNGRNAEPGDAPDTGRHSGCSESNVSQAAPAGERCRSAALGYRRWAIPSIESVCNRSVEAGRLPSGRWA